MSTLAQPFVTWEEFLRLPERPENASGIRYELHDGEVVIVPPPSMLHKKLQKRIERLIEALAGDLGVVTQEFGYRPQPNLQYWVADVVYIPRGDWDNLPLQGNPIYAPKLIVEIPLSVRSTGQINKQRLIAMSAGTEESWVVDPEGRTIHVTNLRSARSYRPGEHITFLTGDIPVDEIFRF